LILPFLNPYTPLPFYSWWQSCFTQGSDRFSGKAGSMDHLSCCASLFGCECVRQYCVVHPSDAACSKGCGTKNCNGISNATVEACDALPERSFFGRNPWIWLVLVAVIVAAIVLITIWFVYRKKFGSGGGGSSKHRKGSKGRLSKARLSLGAHMNVESSMELRNKVSCISRREERVNFFYNTQQRSKKRSSSHNLVRSISRGRSASATKMTTAAGGGGSVQPSSSQQKMGVSASVSKNRLSLMPRTNTISRSKIVQAVR